MYPSDRPLFVGGVPKSGTTVVGHVISQHPDFAIDTDHYVTERFLSCVDECINSPILRADSLPRRADVITTQHWLKNDYANYKARAREFFVGFYSGYSQGLRWGE